MWITQHDINKAIATYKPGMLLENKCTLYFRNESKKTITKAAKENIFLLLAPPQTNNYFQVSYDDPIKTKYSSSTRYILVLKVLWSKEIGFLCLNMLPEYLLKIL